MFRKPVASRDALPAPYAGQEVNFLYNLLFCDQLAMFRPSGDENPAPWQQTLFAEPPDTSAISALAADVNEESRIRLLAYNWLRQNRQSVPSRQLLGVIVEVPLDAGLDTLAAYQDGRVRYINQTGKIAVFEGAPPQVASKALELLAASQTAVNTIGPWDKPRLAPPARGNVRMTFLVSDGLYFCEGPFTLMQREPLAAPILQRAGELLQLVVSTAGK